MIERPRGTRDLGPDEMETRNDVEEAMRKVCESFGYSEVLTPTFEHTKLFMEKSGPSIVEEIYAFEDKGGREIALRPEFTAPVMRMYADSMRENPKPLKLFYFGPTFRYERPQSGRYREFWQFGTELIGPDTPRADAENIALACRCVEEAGLENYSLKVSNLNILSTLLEERGISEEELDDIFHLIDKEEFEDLKERYESLQDIETLFDSSLDDLKEKMEDKEPVEYLQDVLKALEYYGLTEENYQIDLKTVRGLDYYKGVVFELEAENLGAEKQICGGGDYSLGDIFGIDISSKGFAIGFDRTILAIENEGNLPKKKRTKCYIVPIGEESIDYCYEILDILRKNNITTDIDLMDRSVGKALSYADKNGFSHSLLIGGNEVEDGTVTIKDMKSGEQKTIPKEDVLNEVG
ncbi:MAG: histidine--tRNA ligase [Thermoplasmatota archaeon]